MSTQLVDIRDRQALFNVLSQVFLFSEQLNAVYARQTRRNKSLPFKVLVHNVRRSLDKQTTRWEEASELLSLLGQAGVKPQMNNAVLIALVERMLGARGLLGKSNPPRRQSANVEALSLLRTHEDRLCLYKVVDNYYFADWHIPKRDLNAMAKLHTSLYIPEVVNPIENIKDFLVHVLNIRQNTVNHYVQQWIKKEFCFSYTTPFKYRLASIVRRFNELFFNIDTPSRRNIRRRPNTISLGLVLEEISNLIDEPQLLESLDKHHSSLTSEHLPKRVALGIYLFFRFCNVLRSRFHWPEESTTRTSAGDLEVPENAVGKLIRGEADGWHAMWNRGYERQCVSALRPLEYTYFQTRIFGALSGISGLNNIFRGGILPRTEGGRTFILQGPPGAGKTALALHMMADLAYRGRIAIYISFEENYITIMDRLVTFNLVDPTRFDVIVVGDAAPERIKENLLSEDPPKGLLVLYAYNGTNYGEHFDLIKALDAIAVAADTFGTRRGRWRAVTVDSINALSFHTTIETHEEVSRSYSLRRTLVSLIDCIERNGFWGVILSEKDDPEFAVLPYLADTVVSLGLNETKQSRWIQIEKSRTQNYHPGPHPFRISEGKGVNIYPSLNAVQTTLRRRGSTTLSTERSIHLSAELISDMQCKEIAEKSSTLLWGPSGSKKTLLLLHIATEPSQMSSLVKAASAFKGNNFPLSSIMLVTFRTPEVRFMQALRQHKELSQKWDSIRSKHTRLYSLGGSLTGEQLLVEIEENIYQSRRVGIPIERVLFDEVETAEYTLPALQRDPLFWPTLIDLLTTEAITSFFVITSDKADSEQVDLFRNWVDYSFEVSHQKSIDPPMWNVNIEKHPDLSVHESRVPVHESFSDS